MMKNNKPMELKFGDLTAEEKDKYIHFLVTNNIIFEEEKENSNYVATIKFTNNEAQKTKQSIEKKKSENNKSQYSDAFAIAGSFSSSNAFNKNKERKELKEIQNTCETKEDIWIRAGKEQLMKKRSKSSNQTEKNNSSNEKSERKENDSKIPKNILILKKFSKFLTFFKFIDPNVHPKKFPKEWALKLIEEIYTFKFNKDTKSIKLTKNVNTSKETNLNEEFPAVVFLFFLEKFKNLKLAEQNAINFTATVEFYEKDHLDISLFSNFLTDLFDKNDLIFFLFVRSILEKELGLQIYSCLRKEYVDLNNVDISMKQCFHIVTNVFGPQEKDLINNFSIMIKSYFSNQKTEQKGKTPKMKAYQFFYLLLQEYHQNKLESQNKINTYPTQNQRSFDNCTNETSFICGKKINIESEPIATTTKNLKPEFDNVFNEMITKNTGRTNENSNCDEMKYHNILNEENEFEVHFNDVEKVSSNGSNQNSKVRLYSEFEKKILTIMEGNVAEFINLLADENSELSDPKDLIKLKLNKIVLRKVYKLCESLFDYDKLHWFNLLKIENPSAEQLGNVENLQKDLRKLQKINFFSIEKNELDKFCKNILQTPELAKEIGRLVVAFMMT